MSEPVVSEYAVFKVWSYSSLFISQLSDIQGLVASNCVKCIYMMMLILSMYIVLSFIHHTMIIVGKIIISANIQLIISLTLQTLTFWTILNIPFILVNCKNCPWSQLVGDIGLKAAICLLCFKMKRPVSWNMFCHWSISNCSLY